ncbi:selenocysteine-specific translation elongation factor [Caenimonas aquaedulcis]|uniref:Selenocysteine-specific elongation factor n=1 Tax=Caenimonas aquaedulcis TaxID=2793270 RepID=A0A931H8I2_9BURK|nr:selenocysteine-specific translation elongation factor [Caenimonas aquaedulcis]MBG9390681.1 selenocysteine-specific translation elongation factor [Caenimonas aquaedulcis]
MIVATAGHIDHGKTTLVKALTGVDTDRLPEEKARGISIDIGFAYATLPTGASLAFVDVPGHERFIHNMLAGVAGIDFALLVVAADDGPMPQTREHLHILDLFGVASGVAVITKVDRVAPERVAQVRADVAALLAGTALAGSPVLEVSAPGGLGIEALQELLAHAAAARATQARQGRGFRFTIDRSFSASGSGTVVTGTVHDGELALGDKLVVSPSGLPVRVRGIHQRGHAGERAGAGERCAINIAGATPAQAGRGMWLVAPHAHAATQRVDAHLRLLASDRKPLRHWDPVHFHIGTADVLARVVMPGDVLAPGHAAIVQFALDKPVSAVLGDRFVIRDPSAQVTLGGGRIVDPFALHPRGRREARDTRLAALEAADAQAAWTRLLDASPHGVGVQAFRRTFNLTPAAMQALLDSSRAALPGGDQAGAFSAAALQALEDTLLSTLRAFHGATPHAAGMDTDRLLRKAFPKLAHKEALALLRAMAAAGAVDVRGSLVRLPGHQPAARAGDAGLWKQLEPLYATLGVNIPLLREVAARSGVEEPALRDLLKHRQVSGEMVRIATDRFLPRPALAQLAEAIVALARARGQADFTIADYRDFTGIGRNLAIEVLEYFDRLGLTQRGADSRSIRCLDEHIAASLRDPDWRPGALQPG